MINRQLAAGRLPSQQQYNKVVSPFGLELLETKLGSRKIFLAVMDETQMTLIILFAGVM